MPPVSDDNRRIGTPPYQAEAPSGRWTPDSTLLALQNLVEAAQQVAVMSEYVTARAAHIRPCRLQGLSYREIVGGEELPLIAGLLPDHIQRLESASTRLRQAEAAALHMEGMTMEDIGQIFGLTRQRISTLIRGAPATPPIQNGEHDTSPPPRLPTTDARRDHDQPESPSP